MALLASKTAPGGHAGDTFVDASGTGWIVLAVLNAPAGQYAWGRDQALDVVPVSQAPQAPTQAVGDASNAVATDAFVAASLAAELDWPDLSLFFANQLY